MLPVVDTTIKTYIQENGFTVMPTFRFEDAWETCEAELGGLYDPRTGQPDPRRWGRCMSNTLRKLAQDRPFSGVLLPKVVYANVELKHPYDEGTWDGVSRDMLFEGGRPESRWTEILGMTLEVQVFTDEGELAFSAAGGLDFAQKTVLREDRVNLVPKELEDYDPSLFREGVEIALGPFVAPQAVGE